MVTNIGDFFTLFGVAFEEDYGYFCAGEHMTFKRMLDRIRAHPLPSKVGC